MKQLVYASFCYLVLLVGCSKKDHITRDPFDPSVSKTIKDDAYGNASWQKADVYLPANRGQQTNTMVIIHGGFWTSGDKTDLDTLINPVKAAYPNLAIVNMNYRLSDDAVPASRHPAQMNDISLLLDYLTDRAGDWHISNQFALTGISSGGHLALLFAYKYDSRKKVKVVASVLGPTNFADPVYVNSPLFQQVASTFLGKTWLQDSTLHKNVSPVFVVTAGATPTFLAYGGADPLIPLSNPAALRTKFETLGTTYQYNIYPGESHDLSRAAILDIISKITLFFKANF